MANLLDKRRGRLLRDNHVIGPAEHLVEIVLEKSCYVRNRVEYELEIRPVNVIEPNVRLEYSNITAFPD